jgi:zinc protease
MIAHRMPISTMPVFMYLTLGFLGAPAQAEDMATNWKQIAVPPLHAFRPQLPVRLQLSNGMIIFLQEDHEVPLIRGMARIRGGSLDEPPDKVGLVEMYGEVWRTGGTKDRTGDQLDDFLGSRAANVETSGDSDSTSASWDCPKKTFDDAFKVFLELLRAPEFRDDKITLAKNQANTSIFHRNDDSFDVAFRETSKLVYGASSPYARVPEYATVAAITRQDLLSWHYRFVHPNNIILGIVGDFDAQRMETKLRESLESWPEGPPASKNPPSFRRGPKAGIYLVARDDVIASAIQMVDLGTTRDNPDYFALEIFNQFFGRSFSSRLFSNIRSKKGLAYEVGGSVGSAFDHYGVFRLYLSTKSTSTAAAIEAFNEELDKLKTDPITSQELMRAKDAILSSFIFRFDGKEKVLRERMKYEFYGYPEDFLERYRAGIEKVTQQDVERVAQKYVDKRRLAVLVVGNSSVFDRPLSTFGPVTRIDVTIPAPPSESTKGQLKAGRRKDQAGEGQ